MPDYHIIERKAQEFVFADLARRLNISGNDSFVEGARLVNSFCYGNPMIRDKEEDTCKSEVDSCENPNGECEQHCKNTKKAKVSSDFIRELMELSVPTVNEAMGLLPNCQWASPGECWTRVITDRGLCFSGGAILGSSSKGLQLKPRSFTLNAQTTRSRFSFEGMLKHFGHPKFSMFEDDEPDYYDVIIMQPGQFAISKTSSEKMAVAVLGENEWMHYSWEVGISPMLMLRGTPEFKDMDILKRSCLCPDEKQLSIAEGYSQANCYLECAWKEAIENCDCVPWFMIEMYPETDICDQFGNSCFKDMVDGRYEVEEGTCSRECPNDCEILEFEVSLEMKKKMDTLRVCKSCEHIASLDC